MDEKLETPADMPVVAAALVHPIPLSANRAELAAKQLDQAIIQVEHTYGRTGNYRINHNGGFSGDPGNSGSYVITTALAW